MTDFPSPNRKPAILITRPRKGAEELAQRLDESGAFRPVIAPVMDYANLTVHMDDLNRFSALLFTSAHAVDAFSALCPSCALPVLAVGDSTADAARRAGFGDVMSAQGDSGDVVRLLREHASPRGWKNILHPCSADTPDYIGRALDMPGVAVERRVVYKAVLLNALPAEIVWALHAHEIDAVLLFSARAARQFVALMEKSHARNAAKPLLAICISPRVQECIKDITWLVPRASARPNTESMLETLSTALSRPLSERRGARGDRRQRAANRDAQGLVNEPEYKGPDRRSGLDRRAYELRQRERVFQEKMRFINRTILSFAFLFLVIVMAFAFLMAPEYLRLNRPDMSLSSLSRIFIGTKEGPSFGGVLNHQIENVQGLAALAVSGARSLQDIGRMLDDVSALRTTAEGSAALSRAVAHLRLSLGSSPPTAESVNAAVRRASQDDPTLSGLFDGIGRKDIAAAALLLVLNEFRSNVDASRPFDQDLAILQNFVGNDPAMIRALQRLAPYAQNGVMTRGRLQEELQGLAGDIVTAQMAGQDVSVKERALERLARLQQASDARTIDGRETEAVVARAQAFLAKGDVRAAARELQSLEGASAATAAPWVEAAAGRVVADSAADDLSQTMLGALSAGGGGVMHGLLSKVRSLFGGGGGVSYLSPTLQGSSSGYSGVLAR